MTLRQMTEKQAVVEIASDFKAYSERRSGGNLFLIGAGASYSCGIPLGQDIADDLMINLKKKGRGVPPHNNTYPKRNPYEIAISQYTKHEQINIIRGYINKARSSDGRWKLNHSYMVLAEIWKNAEIQEETKSNQDPKGTPFEGYPRVLLTTNFAPLFFYAMLEQNIEPKLIRHPVEVKFMEPFKTDIFPSIIFFHGYWHNHFILNDESEWKTHMEKWEPQLVGHLKDYGLVVLGYAGSENDVVMLLLNKMQQEFGAGETIYWCYKDSLSAQAYAKLDKIPNLVVVPIQDADSFLLKVGEKLSLPRIKQVAAFSRVIKRYPPAFIFKFQSHAEILIEPQNAGRKGILITIRLHKDHQKPGENYAGFDIYSIQRLFDLSEYSNAILKFDAKVDRQVLERPTFEFKLQSGDAAHIENIEIGLDQEKRVPLQKFTDQGVDLAAVDRIVIATNCEQIGSGSKLELLLKELNWS